MTGVVKRVFSNFSKSDDLDEYNVEWSFAMEYDGPAVSYEIPQVVPVDVDRIPTAAAVAKASLLYNLSIPTVQPIEKSVYSKKKPSKESNLASEVADLVASRRDLGEIRGSSRVLSNKLVNGGDKDGGINMKGEIRGSSRVLSNKLVNGVDKDGGIHMEGEIRGSSRVLSNRLVNGVDKEGGNDIEGVDGNRSSGTLGFSDSRDDSNDVSGSSDVEDSNVVHDEGVGLGEYLSHGEITSDKPLSSGSSSVVSSREEVEDSRIHVVTFRDKNSEYTTSGESYDDMTEDIPERPVARSDGKKGSCYRCHKGNRFTEKEVCIVCGAKYCGNCLVRAMGSMPEGRKCSTCIGYVIDESKRGTLGKSSRMLKRLLTDSQIKKIMTAEASCKTNQLPPRLFCVNEKPLTLNEFIELRNCENPPKKLKPGDYWYDKVSGFWGKEGEKPCQIISPNLAVGGQITKDASNGNTGVLINGRVITKPELLILQFAGIRCEGSPSYWVSADGSISEEGQKNEMGKLWEKTGTKLFCAALSLPVPPESKNPHRELVDGDVKMVKSNNLDHNMTYKLLLVGCDQSGTSTIFKQAKLLYEVPFSEDERQNVKFVIQRNLYRYVATLLEGREKFEEDYLLERRQLLEQPGPSGISEQIDAQNIYSISPKLKSFSDWLLQVYMSGNLEAIFPAATREYSSLIEDLWKDKAFQATYRRRTELDTLPGVANYFLDRANEISQVDYEPSDMDILYAEGITSSNGIASMEFSAQESALENLMEPLDQNDSTLRRYQLIRVNARSLGENCKWLEMFEDVDQVLFCVSLTDYREFHEDINGVCTNKMLATRNFFESIITHPTFEQKKFVLILNKFDLLEETIENAPLSLCDWFDDFNPVISHHPNSRNNYNNSSLAQRAFHYIAVKFKRLFKSLTGRKLFVSYVTGLESQSVKEALEYAREILKWEQDRAKISNGAEWSSGSIEASTTS